MRNEVEAINVLPERLFQSDDIGCWVGRISHVVCLPREIVRQTIQVEQRCKVDVLSGSTIDRVQNELSDPRVFRSPAQAVDVVVVLFPDREGVDDAVVVREQMGLENLGTKSLLR